MQSTPPLDNAIWKFVLPTPRVRSRGYVNWKSTVGERDPSPGVGGREMVPLATGVALTIVKVADGVGAGVGVGVDVGVLEPPHPRVRASTTAVHRVVIGTSLQPLIEIAFQAAGAVDELPGFRSYR